MQLQGVSNVVKYGKLVIVFFIIYITKNINTGDILGSISFASANNLSNIPVGDVETSNKIWSLDIIGNQIKVGSTAPSAGKYAISFAYITQD